MDKISKGLKKFSPKEREVIKQILSKIKKGPMAGLEIKKLKSHKDIFRVRKGKIRIIYKLDDNGNIFILTIERRADTTYNF